MLFVYCNTLWVCACHRVLLVYNARGGRVSETDLAAALYLGKETEAERKRSCGTQVLDTLIHGEETRRPPWFSLQGAPIKHSASRGRGGLKTQALQSLPCVTHCGRPKASLTLAGAWPLLTQHLGPVQWTFRNSLKER
ncbi:hypothetical protein VULLAG_LOCUS14408 [Vulpes lagopus]